MIYAEYIFLFQRSKRYRRIHKEMNNWRHKSPAHFQKLQPREFISEPMGWSSCASQTQARGSHLLRKTLCGGRGGFEVHGGHSNTQMKNHLNLAQTVHLYLVFYDRLRKTKTLV